MQDLCPGPCALPVVRLYVEDRARAFCIPGAICFCAFSDSHGHSGTDTDICANARGHSGADTDICAESRGHSGADAHNNAGGRAALHPVCHGRRLGDRCCLGQPSADRCDIGSDGRFHTGSDADAEPKSDIG